MRTARLGLCAIRHGGDKRNIVPILRVHFGCDNDRAPRDSTAHNPRPPHRNGGKQGVGKIVFGFQ